MGGEWLIRFPAELGEDVFAARTADSCGRSAECGGRRADVCGARRECGVRSAAGRCLRSRPAVSAEPADVCGVRSADRAECGLQTAMPADIRGARTTAEYCGLMRSTEFCYLIRQAVLVRQATVYRGSGSGFRAGRRHGAPLRRRIAECGTQQGLRIIIKLLLTGVATPGGLVSAHASSRTFPSYPDPTILHLPEYGQPLP